MGPPRKEPPGLVAGLRELLALPPVGLPVGERRRRGFGDLPGGLAAQQLREGLRNRARPGRNESPRLEINRAAGTEGAGLLGTALSASRFLSRRRNCCTCYRHPRQG